MSVILTHGYEGVSVEAVAREAGVTRPVVYDHFQNLADLLQTLFAREERISLEQLSRVVLDDAADRDPVELLIGGVTRFLEAVSERPQTWRLILLPPRGPRRWCASTSSKTEPESSAGPRPWSGPQSIVEDSHEISMSS